MNLGAFQDSGGGEIGAFQQAGIAIAAGSGLSASPFVVLRIKKLKGRR